MLTVASLAITVSLQTSRSFGYHLFVKFKHFLCKGSGSLLTRTTLCCSLSLSQSLHTHVCVLCTLNRRQLILASVSQFKAHYPICVRACVRVRKRERPDDQRGRFECTRVQMLISFYYIWTRGLRVVKEMFLEKEDFLFFFN